MSISHAWLAGNAAHDRGVPRHDNLFPAGTESHDRWNRGWDKAARERLGPGTQLIIGPRLVS